MYKQILDTSIFLIKIERKLECKLLNFLAERKVNNDKIPYVWCMLFIFGLIFGFWVRSFLACIGLLSIIQANYYFNWMYELIVAFIGYNLGWNIGFWLERMTIFRMSIQGCKCREILKPHPKNMRYSCNCHHLDLNFPF
ncbi:MAG: hypothetical protein CXT73_06525 [Methanobacteriota archaeon]|nr:MAG: hypothetical protein CXT73_06525 [Euryarchaeota archaeon]